MSVERLLRTPELWAAHLTRPFELRAPFGGPPFAALWWVAAEDVTPQEQARMSERLVALGCRYAVCGGHACSSWDDSIDQAAVEAQLRAGSDEPFVMTSWHEGEPRAEVAFFLANCTSTEEFRPTRFLVVSVGGDGESHRALCAAARAALARTSAG